jgi:uncharacterized membrane protein
MDHSVLSKIPLFAKLSEAELAELAGYLRQQDVEAQHPIVWIGEVGTEFYIIQHGQAAVVVPDESGNEVTLSVLGPGQFFGEISLIDGGVRTATVRTITPATLLVLGRDEFHQFIRKHPSAAIQMLTILGQRQRETLDKLRGIKNVNQVVDERTPGWRKISLIVASMTASEAFILLNIAFFAFWIVANILRGQNAIDPFPFGLLGFIVSIESLFISLFVLISQNREGDRNRIQADQDYQVNRKAHLEVMGLHQKMDRILTKLNSVESAQAGGQADPDR